MHAQSLPGIGIGIRNAKVPAAERIAAARNGRISTLMRTLILEALDLPLEYDQDGLAALPRSMAGASVTRLEVDLGYHKPAAFTTMFKRPLGASPRMHLLKNTEG